MSRSLVVGFFTIIGSLAAVGSLLIAFDNWNRNEPSIEGEFESNSPIDSPVTTSIQDDELPSQVTELTLQKPSESSVDPLESSNEADVVSSSMPITQTDVQRSQSSDQTLQDSPRSSAGEPVSRKFDGTYSSDRYDYAFRVEGTQAICTKSNSSMYSVGQVMFTFELDEDGSFEGHQIYTDGNWYRVRGRFVDDRIEMSGTGNRWVMTKQ